MAEVECFGDYFAMPSIDAETARLRRERVTLKQARYKHRHPDRVKAKDKRRDRRHKTFIFWDGEGPRDAGYALFGNSAGFEICHPFLGTLECLELIMETEIKYPDAIHIGFGFNYDVSMMLKDVPHKQLNALRWWNKTVWEDWEIEHIPFKWLKVRRGKIEAKIYDILSFFSGNYVSSLVKFNVGSKAEIAAIMDGKAGRKDFLWKDIQEIRQYWLLELKLGPPLGDALLAALDQASYVPTSWHGPGAVARMALKRHGIYDAMAKCPAAVRMAARRAFIGGRSELLIAGLIPGPIWEYDLNSAYPYYATQLPNLTRGKWRRGKSYEPGKFALYNIIYDAPYDPNALYPLYRRYKDQTIRFSNNVEGWYWAPEAELVKNDPHAVFIESLVFDEDDPTDRPFNFLFEYYRRRKDAQARGDMLAYSYKIIINAIWGQLAQRVGWDRKTKQPPKTHQLEWAGYVTSGCRAAVYKAGKACGDKLISITTDSVQARCPVELDVGDELGQWSRDEYSEGIFWQSGIYYLREELGYDSSLGYGWVKSKFRGIRKGAVGTPEQLTEAVKTMEPLTVKGHTFYGYSLAVNGKWEKLNTWEDTEQQTWLGGTGKRFHYMKGGLATQVWCRDNCDGHMHRLRLRPPDRMMGLDENDNPIKESRISEPHYLPWVDGPSELELNKRDISIWDIRTLDADEEWLVDEYL